MKNHRNVSLRSVITLNPFRSTQKKTFQALSLSLKEDPKAWENIFHKFSIFDGIGCLPEEYTINVHLIIHQVVHPPQ